MTARCARCAGPLTVDVVHTTFRGLGLFPSGASYCPSCWSMIGGAR